VRDKKENKNKSIHHRGALNQKKLIIEKLAQTKKISQHNRKPARWRA
jgi:hypothetical protein